MTRSARAAALAVAAMLAAPGAAHAAVLTSGVLTNSSGAPTGGQVRVYAFQLPRGGEKPHAMPLLGTAQAAADGRFTVVADDAQLAGLAAARGGWLDVAAVGDTPGATAQWGFTVHVDGGTVSTADAAIARAAKAPAPFIHLEAVTPRPFTLAAQFGRCDNGYEARKPVSVRKLAVVGELNNAYSDGTRGQFSYARGRSAETYFGIAGNYDGHTLTIGGENLISDEGKVSFPPATRRYSRKLRSMFEFTKYEVRASSCAVWSTEVRATAWIGGTDSATKQAGLDKCDSRSVAGFEGTATYDRTSNSAVRYTRAVDVFGVNLTSRSGFSRNVALSYSFGGTTAKEHYLCGPDGKQSPFIAGRVFSGSRK